MTHSDCASARRDDSSLDAAPVIRTKDVIKTYRTGSRAVQALRGVSLSVNEPGFYAIMGPSGSGKSTLLHLLAALDRPDSGTIEIGSMPIEALNEAQLTLFRRRRIGIVFQQFNLISTLNALDNVTLPAMLDGVPKRQRDERALELLAALGLKDRASHRPDALSGGEQQRVAIARALYFEPAVLLADEPTGNLDSASSQILWALLKELAQQRQLTVLMVTHEPSAAIHCRQIFVIRDGLIETTMNVEGMNAADLASQLAARTQHPRR